MSDHNQPEEQARPGNVTEIQYRTGERVQLYTPSRSARSVRSVDTSSVDIMSSDSVSVISMPQSVSVFSAPQEGEESTAADTLAHFRNEEMKAEEPLPDNDFSGTYACSN